MNWIANWLIGKVKDYVVHNWKTTLVGLLGAVLSRYVTDPAQREAILAATLAILGLVAKDGDKTGTTAQPAPGAELVTVTDPSSEPIQGG